MTDPSDSQTLRAMGLDALADVPKGLRRHFTPGAVITICGTLVAASVTCATFYADARAARQHETDLKSDRDKDHDLLQKMDKDGAVFQATVNDRLKALEDEAKEQKAYRNRVEGVASVPTNRIRPRAR